ncbi:MaoC family dehydratase [Streptomyces zagrosensis]|uniref:Acyl dehydratase n=1 Tax=Streptomyces zagrosensis TaxID=1042984 RepID=A0A7W9V1Q8_9ACTN|nr:MaoC/PaaZ C-terminal domain-containing protein [Streptomyces zagrosensis]MBB5938039.1 acyl dehydratase [Streptomyces zagrosensis]
MSTKRLPHPPRLMPLLAKGALAGLGKRPGNRSRLPGTTLVLPSLRADPGRVASYAHLCGFTRPDPKRAAADPERPAADLERAASALPLTYPHILGFPLAAQLMSARAFPLPLLGLVHTAIEITQYEPPRLADNHEVRVYAEGLVPHRRGTEVTIVTEFRRHGTTLWRDRSTYLARHRTPREAPAGRDWAAPGAPGRSGALGSAQSAYPAHPVRTAQDVRDARAASLAGMGADAPLHSMVTGAPLSGMNVAGAFLPGVAATGAGDGALPVRAEWQLPADLGRRHAAVSGDYNPIHLTRLTARPLGFPRAIAHGMWTFARCLAEVVDPTRPQVCVRATFRQPVLLPGSVRFGCDDTRFDLRDGQDTARLHLEGEVQHP